MKIQKKNGGVLGCPWGGRGWVGNWGEGCPWVWRGWVGGRVGGVRVDVNEELKFLGKFTKKKFGGGSGGGVGLVGGQGGCERRIEVFCENSKKKLGGGGRGWVGGTGVSGWM